MADNNDDLIQDYERDITREHATAAHRRLHESVITNSIPIIQAKNVEDN